MTLDQYLLKMDMAKKSGVKLERPKEISEARWAAMRRQYEKRILEKLSGVGVRHG